MSANDAGGRPAVKAPHRGLITASVMLASIMQALDNTIANVALPRIQGSLSATQDQMTWVLTSYIIAAAIMTPLSGWLAGQVGRKRVFLFSIVGFTIASGLCGLSGSLAEIVLARLAQGLCGAALIPMSQAVLLDINPKERHAKAMAIWIMAVTIGPILGPALGGWLTENYNWRWVFYINVPFGILAFLGILSFMPETEIRRSRFDFFGFAALSLAVGAFQLMLDRGQLKDWFASTEILVEAIVAGLALYLFVVHMLTTKKSPFISPALFKDRNFLTGNLFIFVVGVVLFATLALLPPLLQDLLGYPVVLTGLVTAPRGLGTLAAMLVVTRLMGKVDTRWIIAAGFAMTAFSLWQMTHFYLQMGTASVVWSGLTQGFGTGFVYVPLATITFATLSPQFRNEGTAVFSLVRNIGSSVGISVVTTLLVRN
ncbi:MAG TPA: DHA2 family efflux MFS transporter permease subunit, partial [Caldimonas sp.]|nr:DHA2 family efflux MFS transporter permease subunit [Caldimonas sp.]